VECNGYYLIAIGFDVYWSPKPITMWILVWIIISFFVAMAGSNKRIGYWGTFFLSILLSPLIGLIIALVSEQKTIPQPISQRTIATPTMSEMHLQTSRIPRLMDDAEQQEKQGNLKRSLSYYLDAKHAIDSIIDLSGANEESLLLQKEDVEEHISRLKNRLGRT